MRKPVKSIVANGGIVGAGSDSLQGSAALEVVAGRAEVPVLL